jgi:hypothetical protein
MQKDDNPELTCCYEEDDDPEFTCYEDVAGAYLVKYAPKDAQDKRFVSESPTLPQAIERAREKLPHVRDVWIEATKKAADLLKPLASRIAECENFDDLHQFICDNLQSVSGIGPLTCYDFAYLIGAWLKKEPTEVYLHAGTRKGAQAVLGAQANRDRLPVSAFPEGLRRSLTAAQIEDVLCIYHGPLARIAGNGQVETTSQ